jgi:hypothetical protein
LIKQELVFQRRISKCHGMIKLLLTKGESAIPFSADLRFLFLTYPTPQEAEHALRTLDGTKFGKNTLYVNRFGDIERYANMPVGEGELPTGWREKSYVEKVCCGLRKLLMSGSRSKLVGRRSGS